MALSSMFSDQELNQKLALLDARDKRLRQQMTKQTELSKARAYIGACEDMCPERERCLRSGFQLSIFERDLQNQPDEYAMIKEYRRAGADQEEPLPHDLRTLKALQTTVDYIVCNLMDDSRSKSSELALEWYDYLWDRLRAIRKDVTQQNICNQESAILVERCTRFHVHSCYALNRIKDFDVDMNKRNLNDCLQMLRQIYNDLRNTGIVCPGEFEFQKYDILLHLDEDHLSTNVLMKTSEHRSSKEMKFITQIYNAHTNNDYYRFFQLMEKADYMTSCILCLYVNKMRLVGMKIIVAAFNSKQAVWYPAEMAIDSLGFDGLEDLKAFAASLDIEVPEKNSKYYLLLNRELIVSLRNSTLLPVKSRRLIESKMRGLSVGQLVYGDCRLPPNPYKQTPLTTTAEEDTKTTWLNPDEVIDTNIDCSPLIQTETSCVSAPKFNWFIDIQSKIDRESRDSHLDIVDMTTCNLNAANQDQDPVINNLEPANVAAYHVQIESSADISESKPINSRLERSIEPSVEPVVAKAQDITPMEIDDSASIGVKPSLPVEEQIIKAPLKTNQIIEVPIHEDETESIQWLENGNSIEETSNKEAEKRLKIAQDMPAGRFKRSRLGPLESVCPPRPTGTSIILARKSTYQTEQIDAIKESIKDENKANENLFNLLRMFL